MPFALPVLFAATLSLISVAAFAEGRSVGPKPRAVLELFTSQGCAACPPADALMGELIDDPTIIGLTMPTKIWDYLGWADTLASDELTKRQMAYSVSLHNDVFTPQLVVNGDIVVIGSDRAAVRAAVRASESQIAVPIALSVANDILSVDVGEARTAAREAILWLAVIAPRVSVPIRRGENRGRELVYYNVVTDLRPIGMWKGAPLSMDLPLAGVQRHDGAGCVVFAQADSFKGPGPIIGAAMLPSLASSRDVVVAPLPSR